MKYRIRSQKDVAAGLIYVLIGAAFALGALNYRLGDPARMGPGWFPFWIGILLVIVGLFTAFTGIQPAAAEDRIKRPELRTLAWVIGAVVLFGVLLQPFGLVASLFVLVMVSGFASHEFGWGSTMLLAVALIAFSVGVFIYGINLQIPLWPSFIR
jgi:hypothetical protein